jgi:hypothetical protein
MQSDADWEPNLLGAQHKNLWDSSEIIAGICTWKHLGQIEEKFDRKALPESHPELEEEFTVISELTKALSIEPKATYQD